MYYLSLEMVQKAFDFFFNFSHFWNPYFGTGTPLWAPVPPLLVPDSQSMLHITLYLYPPGGIQLAEGPV